MGNEDKIGFPHEKQEGKILQCDKCEAFGGFKFQGQICVNKKDGKNECGGSAVWVDLPTKD